MEISIYNNNFVYLEKMSNIKTYFSLYFNCYSMSPMSSRNGLVIKGFNNRNQILNNWDDSYITILFNIDYINKTSFSLSNNICLNAILSGLDISQLPKYQRTLNIADKFLKSKYFNIEEKRNFIRNFPIPEETNDKGYFYLISNKFTSDEYIDFLLNNLVIKNSDKTYTYLDKNMLNLIPTEYSLFLTDFIIEQNKKL